MKKLLGLGTALLITAGCANTASAQSDWWSKAQGALNSQTGQNILGTLGSQNGTSNGVASALSTSEISAGLREALTIGTKNVVGKLGAVNGFNADPKIHIPLPGTLGRVDSALSSIGMGSLTDDLELRLNRAAEAATPRAKELFINAISQMTISDAQNILTGPNDSATQFLRKAMGPQLSQDMGPIVAEAISKAGAVQSYNQVIGRYSQIPFVPDAQANLNDYVVGKAMDGIFHYVAAEEAAIRQNPAARTTNLLKKVFAN